MFVSGGGVQRAALMYFIAVGTFYTIADIARRISRREKHTFRFGAGHFCKMVHYKRRDEGSLTVIVDLGIWLHAVGPDRQGGPTESCVKIRHCNYIGYILYLILT